MQAPHHTLEEAEAEHAQLQRQVNALHTADLHLQEDEARCRLMAYMQQPEVTGSELTAAVGAKWREQQKGEEDSKEDEEEVPEPPRTQLHLRRELHTAAVARQELTGEFMQAYGIQCGSACNPVGRLMPASDFRFRVGLISQCVGEVWRHALRGHTTLRSHVISYM